MLWDMIYIWLISYDCSTMNPKLATRTIKCVTIIDIRYIIYQLRVASEHRIYFYDSMTYFSVRSKSGLNHSRVKGGPFWAKQGGQLRPNLLRSTVELNPDWPIDFRIDPYFVSAWIQKMIIFTMRLVVWSEQFIPIYFHITIRTNLQKNLRYGLIKTLFQIKIRLNKKSLT